MDLAALTALLTIVFLIMTMVGIGMRLGPPGSPRPDRGLPLLRLAAVSLVVVPVAGVAIALVLPLPPAAAFAIVALAVAPAGTVGPKLVQMAGGDLGLGVLVAFSLSAVATLSVAPSLVVATSVVGLGGGEVAIDPGPIIGRLVVFQLVPLFVGMLIAARRPAHAERAVGPATRLSDALLLSVVVIAVLDGWVEILALGPLPFLAGLVLLGVADGVGWLAGGPTDAGRRTGLLITGQRSGVLALLLAIGIGWPAAVAAVVALASVNLVSNTLVALVALRPAGWRAGVRAVPTS